MEVHQTLWDSLETAEAEAMSQQQRQEEARRISEQARLERQLDEGAHLKIKELCLRAYELCGHVSIPDSNKKTLEPGDEINYNSPWEQLEAKGDGVRVEARISAKTALLDLGNHVILRTWGKSFGNKRVSSWIDLRLTKVVDSGVISSDIDEGVILFASDQDAVYMRQGDETLLVLPHMPEWDEVEDVLDKISPQVPATTAQV